MADRVLVHSPSSGPRATTPIAVGEVAHADVNALYEVCRQPLGADGRPFAEQHYLLLVDGQPVAAVSGSIQRAAPSPVGRHAAASSSSRGSLARPHPHALLRLDELPTDFVNG